MINGAFGLIATGLFASPARLKAAYGSDDHVGFFYSFSHRGGADATLLGIQLLGILFIFGWVMFTMLPFFVWLDTKGWFRSDPLDEIIGLDTSYHGGCVLGTNTEKIGPEHIAAMQRRREEKRANNSRHRSVSLEDIEEEGESGPLDHDT
jgi:ammonia channel protein AmtB